jgi:hypothetical protein
MQHVWAIVGTGVRPQAETDHVIITLFGGREGWVIAREMDATIQALPGMQGLTIFQHALWEALQRSGSANAGSNVTAIPERRRDRPSAMPFAALRRS